MAFDSEAPLDALVTLVSGLSDVQAVYKGVPESNMHRVSAYVTLGGQRVVDYAVGLRRREARYRIVLACRVGGDEAAAEDSVARLMDELEAALFADRTLGGTVESLEVDFSVKHNPRYVDDPRYVAAAGQEYREYRVTVIVRQSRADP